MTENQIFSHPPRLNSANFITYIALLVFLSCLLAHLILQGPTQARATSTSSARTITYGRLYQDICYKCNLLK